MSRAFVKEDGDEPKPRVNFGLPSRRHPGFMAAAALAMIEAARDGYTELAEEETGYKWGDPALHDHVKRLRQPGGRHPRAVPAPANGHDARGP